MDFSNRIMIRTFAGGVQRPDRSTILDGTTTATTTTTSVEGWWRTSTERLLNRDIHPVGSLDSLLWYKAEILIVYWAEDRSRTGLDNCFQILDRLADERLSMSTRNDDDDDDNKHSFQLNIYLIHAILNNWNKQFQKFQTNLLPSKILNRLEGYLMVAPGLFEPNIATYTIILDGASYCPNPTERIGFSRQLLDRLLIESETKNVTSIRPTAVTVGTVLKGLSKSGSLHGAVEAEKLLRRMLELQNTEYWKDFLEVNTIHYTTVIQAYANAGDPEGALRLLMEMLQESIMNGKDEIRPNLRTFNAVLAAWSKSSSSSSTLDAYYYYEMAEELFRRMGQLHENGILKDPPDVMSYNSLLTSLAKCSTRQVTGRRLPSSSPSFDPVEKAETLVTDLLQQSSSHPNNPSLKPTLVTFTTLFQILETKTTSPPEETMKKKIKFWRDTAKKFGFHHDRLVGQEEEGHIHPKP